jgi:hypothetical protein
MNLIEDPINDEDLVNEFKPNLFSPVNKITIVILTKTGRVVYFNKKSHKTDFNVDLAGIEYRIRKEGFYKRDRWLYREVLNRVGRIREYWIIFNEGEPNSLFPSNPRITPYELYMINNSTVMSKALAEWLRSNPFSGKGAFIAIVLALIAGYILIQYGGISL